MGLQERASIIVELGAKLKAPVLAYVTGDRPNLQTQVSSDAAVWFLRHLRSLGDNETLVLLLYTRGGDANATWPIVNQLRSHCDKLIVAVPMYAHSAGTLMSLGADLLVFGRYATLSPIDPTVGNQYNTVDPLNPATRLPIAVEDVLAFLELAKQHDGQQDAFRRLSDQLHPLALGNVQRSINQIKALASRMLGLHREPPSAEDAEVLVSRLTTELYSHQHLIGCREAKSMGLPVADPDPEVEEILFEYWTQLRDDLELQTPFDPAALLRAAPAPPQQPLPAQVVQLPGQPPLGGGPLSATPVKTLPIRLERSYIETASTCDAFVIRGEIKEQTVQVQMPMGMPMQAPQQNVVAFEIHSDRWEALR
jgi:hypothetical protein